jgi:hypothetical protein
MHEMSSEAVAGAAPQFHKVPLALADWGEAQARFAEMLGVDRPLPPGVLRRAMVDSRFAHRLLVSRHAPGFLTALIDDPANERFAPPEEAPADVAEEEEAPASNLALLGRAARSLALWGKAGFTHADEATQAHRLAACAACPHARRAPETLAYRLAGGSGSDKGICGLCGCPVARKARMSTESCPGEHPEKAGHTRWDEPVRG